MTELYSVGTSAFGSYVCNRCGVLVYLSPEAQQRHDDWHAGLTVTDLSEFEVHAIHCNDDTSDVAMWCERPGCDFQFDGGPGEIVPLSTLVEAAESHARDAHPDSAP